jgi:hypothetical protein
MNPRGNMKKHPVHAASRRPSDVIRACCVGLVVALLVGVGVLVGSSPTPKPQLPIASDAAATTPVVCTNPVFTSSTAEATDSITSSDYWWVNNDAWSGGHGPQTIHVCNQSSWYATSDQPNTGGAVETYPDTEYDVSGRSNTHYGPNVTTPIPDFTNITSTFAETFPSGTNEGWDAGYDMWMTNYTDDTMIWNQWSGSNAYWPAQATIAATLGGVGYKFYNNGGELMFFRDVQVNSGSVNILAALKWLVTHGYLKTTTVPFALDYGVEISYTTGTQTFPMTELTMTVNGGTPPVTTTPPKTTTPPPVTTTPPTTTPPPPPPVTPPPKKTPPATKPGAPRGLVAYYSDNSVLLEWKPPSTSTRVTTYSVLRGTTGAALTTLVSGIPAPDQYYFDSTGKAGSTYYYEVEAVTNGVTGPPSNVVSITIPGGSGSGGHHGGKR